MHLPKLPDYAQSAIISKLEGHLAIVRIKELHRLSNLKDLRGIVRGTLSKSDVALRVEKFVPGASNKVHQLVEEQAIVLFNTIKARFDATEDEELVGRLSEAKFHVKQ